MPGKSALSVLSTACLVCAPRLAEQLLFIYSSDTIDHAFSVPVHPLLGIPASSGHQINGVHSRRCVCRVAAAVLPVHPTPARIHFPFFLLVMFALPTSVSLLWRFSVAVGWYGATAVGADTPASCAVAVARMCVCVLV